MSNVVQNDEEMHRLEESLLKKNGGRNIHRQGCKDYSLEGHKEKGRQIDK